MARNPVQFKIPAQAPQPEPFRLTRIDGGICLKYEQSQIRDNQSPDMLNLNADDRGSLTKRYGQDYINETLGEGAINGYFDYRKADGTITTLLTHSDKLYIEGLDLEDNITYTEIFTGLADKKAIFFTFDDICYLTNGTDYIQCDGETCQRVEGHIPLFTMGRSPTGGGTVFEELNYLSNSWTDSFSCNSEQATETEFTLSFEADSIVKAVVNGEEAEYTHTAGSDKVTFGAAPGEGTNHIQITATKTGLMDSSFITNSLYLATYGGANDTRIFFRNNNTVYRSGLLDPTYFPENNYEVIGNDSDNITGAMVVYDNLVILKERSVWLDTFELVDGVPTYTIRPLNSVIGCDMPYSVQLINNNIVFCNTYAGPHIITNTVTRTEKNVMPLGANINGVPSRPGLLDEEKTGLLNATSVDFDGKYWLNVGGKVYLWDYNLTPYDGNDEGLTWFVYDNINASCWLVRDRLLFYGSRLGGRVVKFKTDVSVNDGGRYNDFGEAINAYWRSKLFYFGLAEWLKTIKELHFRTREAANTRLTLRYFEDLGENQDPIEVTSTSFSWENFSWDLFSWEVYNFPPTFRLRPKIKKTVYFQFEVSNNTLSQNLSIMDLIIRYILTKKVK